MRWTATLTSALTLEGHKMPKIDDIADLVSECLDRCRASGFTLTTLVGFLDELRASGKPEVDVQRIDSIMRHILKDVLAAGVSFMGDANAGPPRDDSDDGDDTVKIRRPG